MRIFFKVMACSGARRAPPQRPHISAPHSGSSVETDRTHGLLYRQSPLNLPNQRLTIKRFHDVIGGAQPEAELLLVDYRDENDRNVARQGIGLKRVQYLPPIRTGHDDVESNSERLEFARLLKSILTAAGGYDGVTRVGQVLLEQINDIRIVIDRKHDLISESSRKTDRGRHRLGLWVAFRCYCEPLRDFERERRSRPLLTLD